MYMEEKKNKEIEDKKQKQGRLWIGTETLVLCWITCEYGTSYADRQEREALRKERTGGNKAKKVMNVSREERKIRKERPVNCHTWSVTRKTWSCTQLLRPAVCDLWITDCVSCSLRKLVHPEGDSPVLPSLGRNSSPVIGPSMPAIQFHIEELLKGFCWLFKES